MWASLKSENKLNEISKITAFLIIKNEHSKVVHCIKQEFKANQIPVSENCTSFLKIYYIEREWSCFQSSKLFDAWFFNYNKAQ